MLLVNLNLNWSQPRFRELLMSGLSDP